MNTIDIQLLAMFIGCDIKAGNLKGKLITIELPEYTGGGLRVHILNDDNLEVFELYPDQYDDVKPILRPQKSLTKEERMVIEALQQFCFDPAGNRCWMNTPSSLAALIALRIDIFGWIDKGLAINKYKMDGNN